MEDSGATKIIDDARHGSALVCRQIKQEAPHGVDMYGKPCYPAWLDNLADGVTGSVGLGTAPSNERRPPMKSWSLPANYMSSPVERLPKHRQGTP